MEELKNDILPLPDHTLLPQQFFESFLKCYSDNPFLFSGSWIQIGAWKGGSSLFLAMLRKENEAKGQLHIIDTFGSIPINEITKEKDIAFVNFFQIRSQIENYKIIVEDLLRKHHVLSATNLIETEISALEYNFTNEKITLIFIDVDFYEPTLESLKKTYSLLANGGIIIIDDYYSPFFNCKDAVDDFFLEKSKNKEVKFNRFYGEILIIEKDE